MKNVLIITFSFPPMPDIAAVRPEGLANYLPSYGWNPIFLTPYLPEDPDPRYTVIQTEYDNILAYWFKKLHIPINKAKMNENGPNRDSKERLMKIYNSELIPPFLKKVVFFPAEFFVYPDLHVGWYEHAVRVGQAIIEEYKIDAIISTSPPNTSHLIAEKLSKYKNIPWVADYRDLWTQNHYREYTQIRNYFESRREIEVIKKANALTTVSEPLAKTLKTLHKRKKIYSIPNGFDIQLLNHKTKPVNTFRIAYTGEMYYGKRDPRDFLRLMSDLMNDTKIKKADVAIDFFGGDNEWLQKVIHNYALEDVVTLHGRVPRDIAIEEQRQAQILLLLTWNDPAEEGVYTGKLFDYLAAKRPILSIGHTGGGVVKELLEQTGAGLHISDEEELKNYLIQSYNEFKQRGAVTYNGNHEEIMKYSHIEMARKFAYVLDTVCNSHNKPDGE